MVKRVKITSMELLAQLIQPVLDEGRSAKFTVVGNSMLPLLRNGKETVTVKKGDTIKKYDIIFYRRDNGEYVLHRVVGKGKDGFKLCGDNQLAIEYPVRQENIIALVTEFSRKGKIIHNSKLWYAIYSRLWCWLIPLRPIMFKTAYFAKKLFNMHKKI